MQKINTTHVVLLRQLVLILGLILPAYFLETLLPAWQLNQPLATWQPTLPQPSISQSDISPSLPISSAADHPTSGLTASLGIILLLTIVWFAGRKWRSISRLWKNPFHHPMAQNSSQVRAVVLLLGLFTVSLLLGYWRYTLVRPQPTFSEPRTCQFIGQIHQHSTRYVMIAIQSGVCQQNSATDRQTLTAQTIQYWLPPKPIIPPLQTGATYQIHGQLQPLKSRHNRDQFDYSTYLRRQGIVLSGKKLTFQQIAEPQGLAAITNRIKPLLHAKLTPNNAGIVQALLTGDRQALSVNDKQLINATNTQHLLAISGLHLAIIGFWAWLIGQTLWVGIRRAHRYVMPIQVGVASALVAMLLFAQLTGMHLPVQRAFILFAFLATAWLCLRPLASHALSRLLWAALLILVIQPLAIYDGAFHLSFLATFVIIVVAKLDLTPFGKVLLVQVLISLFLMPISWFLFGQINPLGILANLLVIPWLSLLLLPLAVMTVLITIFTDTLGLSSLSLLWSLLNGCIEVLRAVLSYFASWEGPIVLLTRPSLTVLIIAYALFIYALLGCPHSNPLAGGLSGRLLDRLWQQRCHAVWALFGVGLLLLGTNLPSLVRTPQIRIADNTITNIIVDNGREAILFNAGTRRPASSRLGARNDSLMWLRYLKENHLNLRAIYLESHLAKQASALEPLLEFYPEAQVILLTHQDLPFAHQFCQSQSYRHLKVIASQTGNPHNPCQLQLVWFAIPFSVLNPLDPASELPPSHRSDVLGNSFLGKTLTLNNHWHIEPPAEQRLLLSPLSFSVSDHGMLIISQKNRQIRLYSSKTLP